MNDVFDVLAGLGRQLVLERFPESRASCIVSTAIALDVCKRFGVPARERVVTLTALNKHLYDKLQASNPPTPEERGALIERLVATDEKAKLVGIGFRSGRPGEWGGHLVAFVEDSYLFDLSVDQANRPGFGMCLAPQLWPVTNGFSGEVYLASPCGALLKYAPHDLADSNGYKRSPNWRQTKNYDRCLVVDRCCEEIARRRKNGSPGSH